jgi:hypothetical protein
LTVRAATIALEVSSHNARVAALQKRWDHLRAGLDLILDQRGADMADLPGGASGLLARDQGKKADRLVTRIDPGVVSLVAELRGHEQQTAEELGQWKTRVEERKTLAASPPAITLAMLFTTAELEDLEKRALELERGRRWSLRRDRHSGAGACDWPGGGGPHPARGGPPPSPRAPSR